MLYSKHITIAKNTGEDNPSRTKIKVNKGMIYYFWITFPPGCVGLVKFRIYHEGHPFLPVNQNDYIRGDNVTFQFPSFQEIKQNPEILTVEAWNEDDTYDHTIDIVFIILPKKYIMPVGATEGIMESLKSLVIHKDTNEVQAEELI